MQSCRKCRALAQCHIVWSGDNSFYDNIVFVISLKNNLLNISSEKIIIFKEIDMDRIKRKYAFKTSQKVPI